MSKVYRLAKSSCGIGWSRLLAVSTVFGFVRMAVLFAIGYYCRACRIQKSLWASLHVQCSQLWFFTFLPGNTCNLDITTLSTRKAEVLNSLIIILRPKQTIQLTSCKRFDNNCYHLQCIAITTLIYGFLPNVPYVAGTDGKLGLTCISHRNKWKRKE